MTHMAAEETAFCPAKGAGPVYSPESMLNRRSARPSYYSSLENSVYRSARSVQDPEAIMDPADSPVSPNHSYFDDSSDHEREEDTQSLHCNDTIQHKKPKSETDQLLIRELPLGGDIACGEGAKKEPPISVKCALIPSCVIKNWRYCKLCYGVTITILLLFLVCVASIAIVWMIKVIKYRSNINKNMELSSSAVYNVTSDFPLSNLFSNQFCLNTQATHSMKYTVNKLSYVSLASEECGEVTLSPYSETVTQNSVFGHNYMFYWHNGTTLSFSAKLNGSSTMSVFLLESRRSFDLCIDHITPGPSDYLNMWAFNVSNCGIVVQTGLMACHFQYSIAQSGYYYICVNSTVENELQFNISISSSKYNTSMSKTTVQCMPNEDCCLPFGNVLKELSNPTCMFVTTTPLDPSFSGIRLTDITMRVDQRWSVLEYCLAVFLPLLLGLILVTLLCKITSRKIKNPDINYLGCALYCNIYD